MGYYEPLTSKYIEYVTIALFESDFRDRLLTGRSIYYEFLLETEQTPKYLKFPIKINPTSILRARINLIRFYFRIKL